MANSFFGNQNAGTGGQQTFGSKKFGANYFGKGGGFGQTPVVKFDELDGQRKDVYGEAYWSKRDELEKNNPDGLDEMEIDNFCQLYAQDKLFTWDDEQRTPGLGVIHSQNAPYSFKPSIQFDLLQGESKDIYGKAYWSRRDELEKQNTGLLGTGLFKMSSDEIDRRAQQYAEGELKKSVYGDPAENEWQKNLEKQLKNAHLTMEDYEAFPDELKAQVRQIYDNSAFPSDELYSFLTTSQAVNEYRAQKEPLEQAAANQQEYDRLHQQYEQERGMLGDAYQEFGPEYDEESMGIMRDALDQLTQRRQEWSDRYDLAEDYYQQTGITAEELEGAMNYRNRQLYDEQLAGQDEAARKDAEAVYAMFDDTNPDSDPEFIQQMLELGITEDDYLAMTDEDRNALLAKYQEGWPALYQWANEYKATDHPTRENAASIGDPSAPYHSVEREVDETIRRGAKQYRDTTLVRQVMEDMIAQEEAALNAMLDSSMPTADRLKALEGSRFAAANQGYSEFGAFSPLALQGKTMPALTQKDLEKYLKNPDKYVYEFREYIQSMKDQLAVFNGEMTEEQRVAAQQARQDERDQAKQDAVYQNLSDRYRQTGGDPDAAPEEAMRRRNDNAYSVYMEFSNPEFRRAMDSIGVTQEQFARMRDEEQEMLRKVYREGPGALRNFQMMYFRDGEDILAQRGERDDTAEGVMREGIYEYNKENSPAELYNKAKQRELELKKQLSSMHPLLPGYDKEKAQQLQAEYEEAKKETEEAYKHTLGYNAQHLPEAVGNLALGMGENIAAGVLGNVESTLSFMRTVSEVLHLDDAAEWAQYGIDKLLYGEERANQKRDTRQALFKAFGTPAQWTTDNSFVDFTRGLIGDLQSDATQRGNVKAIPQLTDLIRNFNPQIDQQTAEAAAKTVVEKMAYSGSENYGHMIPSMLMMWASAGLGAWTGPAEIGTDSMIKHLGKSALEAMKTPGFLQIFMDETGRYYQEQLADLGDKMTDADRWAALVVGWLNAVVEYRETALGVQFQSIASGRVPLNLRTFVGTMVGETSEELRQLAYHDIGENFADMISGRAVRHELDNKDYEDLFYWAKYLDTAKDTMLSTAGMTAIQGGVNRFTSAVQAVQNGTATQEQQDDVVRLGVMADEANLLGQDTQNNPGEDQQHAAFAEGLGQTQGLQQGQRQTAAPSPTQAQVEQAQNEQELREIYLGALQKTGVDPLTIQMMREAQTPEAVQQIMSTMRAQQDQRDTEQFETRLRELQDNPEQINQLTQEHQQQEEQKQRERQTQDEAMRQAREEAAQRARQRAEQKEDEIQKARARELSQADEELARQMEATREEARAAETEEAGEQQSVEEAARQARDEANARRGEIKKQFKAQFREYNRLEAELERAQKSLKLARGNARGGNVINQLQKKADDAQAAIDRFTRNNPDFARAQTELSDLEQNADRLENQAEDAGVRQEALRRLRDQQREEEAQRQLRNDQAAEAEEAEARQLAEEQRANQEQYAQDEEAKKEALRRANEQGERENEARAAEAEEAAEQEEVEALAQKRARLEELKKLIQEHEDKWGRQREKNNKLAAIEEKAASALDAAMENDQTDPKTLKRLEKDYKRAFAEYQRFADKNREYIDSIDEVNGYWDELETLGNEIDEAEARQAALERLRGKEDGIQSQLRDDQAAEAEEAEARTLAEEQRANQEQYAQDEEAKKEDLRRANEQGERENAERDEAGEQQSVEDEAARRRREEEARAAEREEADERAWALSGLEETPANRPSEGPEGETRPDTPKTEPRAEETPAEITPQEPETEPRAEETPAEITPENKGTETPEEEQNPKAPENPATATPENPATETPEAEQAKETPTEATPENPATETPEAEQAKETPTEATPENQATETPEAETQKTEPRAEETPTEATPEETDEQRRQNAKQIAQNYGFHFLDNNQSSTPRAGVNMRSWSGSARTGTAQIQYKNSGRTAMIDLADLQSIDEWGKRRGVAIIVDHSLQNGRVNGEYRQGEGLTVHIAQDAENPLRTVFGHELYHAIAATNARAAARMQQAWLDYAQRAGLDMTHEIEKLKTQYREHGFAVPSDSVLREEVVANSLYDVIGDQRTIQILAAQDRGLVQQIRNFVSKVMQDIRAITSKYADRNAGARMLRDTEGAMENMRRMIDEALESTESVAESKKQVKSLGENGEMTKRYQERMDEAGNREEANLANRRLAQEMLQKMGVETNEENTRRLLMAAQLFQISGGTMSAALKRYGFTGVQMDEEMNRAFGMLGKYVESMRGVDNVGYTKLMAPDVDVVTVAPAVVSPNPRKLKRGDDVRLSLKEAAEVAAHPSIEKFSIKQGAEAAGLMLKTDVFGQPYAIVDKNGNEIKEFTVDMIENTPMGTMINAALEVGNINKSTADKQKELFSKLMTMICQYKDAATVWELVGNEMFSSIKSNADAQYGTTVDFGTICSKTQAIINHLSDVMAKTGKGLTREQVIQAYDTVARTGLTVPCPVCYVFSRWMGVPSLLGRMAEYQDRFSRMTPEEIREYVKSIEEHYDYARNKTSKDGTVKKLTIAQAINAMKTTLDTRINKLEADLEECNKTKDRARVREILREMEELEKEYKDVECYNYVTQVVCKSRGSNVLRDSNGYVVPDENYHPVPKEILLDLRRTGEFAENKDYAKSWRYRNTRGAGMGKGIFPFSGATIGDTVYHASKSSGSKIRNASKNAFLNMDMKAAEAEILRATERMRAQNLIGGHRFQSTSDFRAEWGLDYMMTFLEMQAIKAQGQLYTKVIEAVPLFASAGIFENLSIMPKGNGYSIVNGKKVLLDSDFSSVTGIDFKEALEMTKKYKTAQMILVGINDDHIILAMADDRITMIIPWHSSGNSGDVLSRLVGSNNETLNESKNYEPYQNDKVKEGRTQEQKERARVRENILTGKYMSGISDADMDIVNSSEFLKGLYERFYVKGVDDRSYHVVLNSKQVGQIFPHEYWDTSSTFETADVNGKRFVEYCEELGLTPRFEQFKDYKGYWKLLIDRRMYDLEGKYIVPGTITTDDLQETDLPMKTQAKYDPSMYSEQYREALQKTLDNLKAMEQTPAYPEADLVEEYAGQETGTRYSVKEGANAEQDAAYMEAVERGDMKTAQEMVDVAAKDAGYTMYGYHGTKMPTLRYDALGYGSETDYANKRLPFTIFRAGQSGGIYVATNREVSQGFARNYRDKHAGTVMSLYVRFENPMIVNEHVWTSVPHYYNIPTPTVMLKEGYPQKELSTEEISAFAQSHGYDGVIIEGIREGADTQTDDLIAFSPEQLKLADPVVYDDSGNVIPLSERFDPSKEDIRWSLKDTATVEQLQKELEDANRTVEDLTDRVAKQAEEIKRLRKEGKGVQGQQAENLRNLTQQLNLAIAGQLEAEHRLEVAGLEISSDRNVIQNLRAQKNEYQRKYEEQKAENRREFSAWKHDYRESRQQAERREKNLKNINKAATSLNQMIDHPSKKKGYVPQEMMEAARMMANAVNEGRGMRAAMEDFDRLISRARYDEGQWQGFSVATQAYVQEALNVMEEARRKNGGEAELTRNLKPEDIDIIAAAVQGVVHDIRTAGQLIGQERARDAQEEAAEAIRDANKHPRVKKGAKELARLFFMNQTNPKTMFDVLDGGRNTVWGRMGDEMQGAQRKCEFNLMKYEKVFNPLLEGKDNERKYKRFTGKNAVLIETGMAMLDENGEPTGRNAEISHAQLCSLYMNRHIAENLEAMRVQQTDEQIMKNGERYQMSVPDAELLKKGKLKEAVQHSHRVIMTLPEIDTLLEEMTDYDKKFCEAWREAAKIWRSDLNEASNKLVGFDIARVDDYFTITRDQNYVNGNFESVVVDNRIANMGITHERVKSTKPVVLMPIVDMIKKQNADVSVYSGWAVAMRDFQTLYFSNAAGYDTSFREAIIRNFGSQMAQYFEDLARDINGDGKVRNTVIDSLRSNIAKGVLAGNMAVTVKQAASIANAIGVLDPDCVMKALPYYAALKKINAEKLSEYTAAFYMRQTGTMASLEANANRESMVAKGVYAALDTIRAMDEATTRVLIKACEFQVQKNNPEMEIGSDAYWKEVAKKYDQMIEETQPSSGVMQKNPLQRNKSTAVQAMIMFRTQLWKNLNRVIKVTNDVGMAREMLKENPSSEEAKQNLKAKQRTMALTISGQVASAIMIAVLNMLGKMLLHKTDDYKDEKGDITMEAAGGRLAKDTISSMAGMVLGGSELFDFINGVTEGKAPYDIEAVGVSTINDLQQNLFGVINAGDTLADSSLSAGEKVEKLRPRVWKLAGTIGELFGVPVNNIRNLLDGLIANGKDLAAGEPLSFESTGWDFLGAAKGRNTSNADVAGYIARAMASGDTAEAERLYNGQLAQGKTPQSLNTAIANWQKENIPQIKQAAQAIEDGDISLYNRLVKEITEQGVSTANAVKYVESERKKLQEAAQKKEEENENRQTQTPQRMTYDQITAGMTKEASDLLYTNGMMNSLLEDGNVAQAVAVKNAMLESGKEQSKINASLTSYWKPILQAAYDAGDMQKVRQITEMLLEMGMNRSTIQGWTGTKTSGSSGFGSRSFGSGSFGSGSFGSGTFGKNTFGSGSFGTTAGKKKTSSKKRSSF